MSYKYIALPLLLCSSLAVANEYSSPEQGLYLGGFVGQSSFDVPEMDSGFDFNVDDSDTAFKLIGGYQFSEYFAVELGYVDLGEFSFNYDDSVTEPEYQYSMSMKVSGAVDGLTLAVVGILPLNEQVNLYAKVGMFSWEGEVSGSGQYQYSDIYGTNDSDYFSEEPVTDDDNSAFYGLGLSYQLSQLSLHAEYEMYDLDGDDVSLLSIGATYHF